LKHFILIALLAALCMSCEFEIDETVFTEVKQPDTSDLQTIVFANSLDSLYIYKKSILVFEVDLEDFELYEIFLFIDGNRHQIEQNENQFFFEFDPTTLSNGGHSFVLKGFTSTETNSLADVTGREYYELTKEFKVYVDLVPPDPVVIDSIYVADGTLNIAWKKPEKSNYIKLKINSKVYYDCPDSDCGFYRNIGLNKDLDKDSEFYKDFDYGGFKIAYSVDIIGYGYQVAGPLRTFDTEPVKVSAEYKDNSKIYFSWDSLLLYKNNLSIQINDGPSAKHADLVFSESGEYQDEFDIEIGFFEYFSFVIDTKQDNIYNGVRKHKSTFEFLMGERFHPIREIKYAAGTDKIFVVKPGSSKIYRYDYKTLTLEDSSTFIGQSPRAQVQLLLSQNGSALYYKFQNYLYQIDPQSLEVLKTIDMSEVLDESSNWIYTNKINLANNHLLSFELVNGRYIVDLKSETVVSKLPNIGYFDSTIDPSGTQFVYGDSIYQIVNGELYAQASVASPTLTPEGLERLAPIGFTASGNEFIYYTYGSKMTYVFDLNLMQVVRSFQSKSRLSLDLVDDKLYSTSHEEYDHDNGKMNLYDLNGGLIRSFDTYDSHISGWDFSLIGNKIFSHRGQVYEY